jgi:ABC-type Fe3+/spermidine/putrescine transport system ATPase subunit
MLTLEVVTHGYESGTRALDSASLTIGNRLLGPDGGQSTRMRSIATLQTPCRG